MNIILYCQYLLGMGHLARTLVIAEKLAREHRVVFLCGGTPFSQLEEVPGIEVVWLDPVSSSEDFARYYSTRDPRRDYDDIVEGRIQSIRNVLERARPDVFWVEAYPFARRIFKKEILPSIAFIREHFPSCTVCSSVRDVLLKYGGDPGYRKRVSCELNGTFDTLFVHSDRRRVPFELTFGPLKKIRCPLIYTGYVCREHDTSVQKRSWDEGGDIVVNIGGSAVGQHIFDAIMRCHRSFFPRHRLRIFLFPEDGRLCEELRRVVDPGDAVTVHPFTFDYINYLKAASVAVCMGGYNSIAETIATRTPAVVIPYEASDEQRIRVECLEGDNVFEVVASDAVSADSLRAAIDRIAGRRPEPSDIDMHGAEFVCDFFRCQEDL